MKVLFILLLVLVFVFLFLFLRQHKIAKQTANDFAKHKEHSKKVLLDKEKKLQQHIRDYRDMVDSVVKLEAAQPSREGYSPKKYTNRCCLQLSPKIYNTQAIQYNNDEKTICLYVVKPDTIKKHNIYKKRQVAHEIN